MRVLILSLAASLVFAHGPYDDELSYSKCLPQHKTVPQFTIRALGAVTLGCALIFSCARESVDAYVDNRRAQTQYLDIATSLNANSLKENFLDQPYYPQNINAYVSILGRAALGNNRKVFDQWRERIMERRDNPQHETYHSVLPILADPSVPTDYLRDFVTDHPPRQKILGWRVREAFLLLYETQQLEKIEIFKEIIDAYTQVQTVDRMIDRGMPFEWIEDLATSSGVNYVLLRKALPFVTEEQALRLHALNTEKSRFNYLVVNHIVARDMERLLMKVLEDQQRDDFLFDANFYRIVANSFTPNIIEALVKKRGATEVFVTLLPFVEANSTFPNLRKCVQLGANPKEHEKKVLLKALGTSNLELNAWLHQLGLDMSSMLDSYVRENLGSP